MRIAKRLTYCAVVALLQTLCVAGAAQTGTISGSTRDMGGKPVAGAKISLTADQPSAGNVPIEMHTASNAEGRYEFTGLAFGRYSIAAEMAGFAPAEVKSFEISPNSRSSYADFEFKPVPNAAPNAQPNATGGASRQHSLKFEAAGVRGLIDPGGYSAPANAAAASGLISGVADIERADNRTSPKNLPCALEPELQKAAAAPDQAGPTRKLGEFYIAHNQAQKAIPLLQRARRINANDEAAAQDLAVALMKTGDFDAARGLLSDLTKTKPSPEIHRLMARADEGSGMFEEASQEYQLAAKDEPSEANLFGVGYELILAGLPAEAGAKFKLGLQQHPNSVRLLIGAGVTEFLQGQTSEATLAFLRASDLDPADPRPYRFLASVIRASHEENERVHAAFKRFLDLAPDNAEASYFYALDLIGRNSARNDDAQTEELLKRSIALDPNLANAHLELGKFYGAREDYAAAAREYEITVRLSPNLSDAHYRLASAYRRTGRADLADKEMQIFERLRAQDNSKPADASDIKQFISAFDSEKPQAAQSAQCPSPTIPSPK